MLGLSKDWAYQVIRQVGAYHEIFGPRYRRGVAPEAGPRAERPVERAEARLCSTRRRSARARAASRNGWRCRGQARPRGSRRAVRRGFVSAAGTSTKPETRVERTVPRDVAEGGQRHRGQGRGVSHRRPPPRQAPGRRPRRWASSRTASSQRWSASSKASVEAKPSSWSSSSAATQTRPSGTRGRYHLAGVAGSLATAALAGAQERSGPPDLSMAGRRLMSETRARRTWIGQAPVATGRSVLAPHSAQEPS